MPPPSSAITQLLEDWSAGDAAARDRLLPLVYDELRALAHHHLADEHRADTFSTTALVHEAYLKLVRLDRTTFRSRAYFYAVASRAMRRILVDYARARLRQRRGGGTVPLPLDAPGVEALVLDEARSADLVALDEALDRLAAVDARMAAVVEHRFFAGLTLDDVAEAMDLPLAEVRREWTMARAWLYRAMQDDAP